MLALCIVVYIQTLGFRHRCVMLFFLLIIMITSRGEEVMTDDAKTRSNDWNGRFLPGGGGDVVTMV